MRGAIPPLPQYAFMEWCLVTHRNTLTFTLTMTDESIVNCLRLRVINTHTVRTKSIKTFKVYSLRESWSASCQRWVFLWTREKIVTLRKSEMCNPTILCRPLGWTHSQILSTQAMWVSLLIAACEKSWGVETSMEIWSFNTSCDMPPKYAREVVAGHMSSSVPVKSLHD
jgi:hypothetical protein